MAIAAQVLVAKHLEYSCGQRAEPVKQESVVLPQAKYTVRELTRLVEPSSEEIR